MASARITADSLDVEDSEASISDAAIAALATLLVDAAEAEELNHTSHPAGSGPGEGSFNFGRMNQRQGAKSYV